MATKDEILAYVRKTPANTNVNVLGSMLEDASGDGNQFHRLSLNDTGEGTYELEDDWQDVKDLLQNDPWNCYVAASFDAFQIRLTGLSVTTREYWFSSIRQSKTDFATLVVDTVTITDNGDNGEVTVVTSTIKKYSGQ